MSVAQKLIITLHISLGCGRGSCYGIKLKGDVVKQSRSKGVYCSEVFQPLGSSAAGMAHVEVASFLLDNGSSILERIDVSDHQLLGTSYK